MGDPMRLDVSKLDVPSLRNALAVRLVQLDDLVAIHDEKEAAYVANMVPAGQAERVRNMRFRASLLAEVERVCEWDRALLALSASAHPLVEGRPD